MRMVAFVLACASTILPLNLALAEAATERTPITLDLLAALHLASDNDPNVAAVRAQRQAASAASTIGRSALLPYLSLIHI